ncbi:MAG: hypothetical protein Q8M29_04640 [Bacteroidota bacterium]|nr:hypothetical protein [Bacteroidota bacterium]
MAFWNNWSKKPEREKMRVIKTARDIESINEAAKEGFRPLVIKLDRSKEISSKFAVFQNKLTGEIIDVGDFRGNPSEDDYECVIEWTSYYPHNFPSPYAAYLLPKDLEKGEWVFLEDLIEDMIGAKWNQGDVYRLESAEAKWNGKRFEIHYDPKKDSHEFMG